jgi:AcrR family transcriptional regulator
VPTDARIIQAAVPLFMELGYRTVTMDGVAAAAGVTKATIYYHFPDKPAVFVATARHMFSRARTSIEQVMARPEPLAPRLLAAARIVLSLPHPFTRFDSMLHDALSDLSPEQTEEVRRYQQSVTDVIEQAFLNAADRGEIRGPDPIFVAHAFIALLRLGQARDSLGTPLFQNTDATASLLVDMLWNGIAARPPVSDEPPGG